MDSDTANFNKAVDLVMEAEKYKSEYKFETALEYFKNALQLMTGVIKSAKDKKNTQVFDNATLHAEEFLRRVYTNNRPKPANNRLKLSSTKNQV